MKLCSSITTEGGDISILLRRVNEGDREAEKQLVPLVYQQLRRLARAHLRRERPNHTLQATELVNEALLHLLGSHPIDCHDRKHFFAIASTQMRHILVDHARKIGSAKRNFGKPRLSLDAVGAFGKNQVEDVLSLDAVITKLGLRDSRQAKIVELRFFAGLSNEETAEVLGVCGRTVRREWQQARAWLYRELERRPEQLSRTSSELQ